MVLSVLSSFPIRVSNTVVISKMQGKKLSSHPRIYWVSDNNIEVSSEGLDVLKLKLLYLIL